VKTLLVDDHAVFRDALAALLATRAMGIQIVGSAPTAREGLAAVRDLSPDLVILDVMLRGPNGIAFARELRDVPGKPRILVLTAVEQPAFVVDALSAGVTGYALKTQGADDLLAAIELTAQGQRYLAPSIEQYATPPLPSQTGDGVISALSKREREVFDLATGGYSNEAIGRALFISVKTVETHRARINRKLRVHSTVQLIRLAALHGLTPV
jgi:DNA-binding NarL/FixJ family response regulator